MHVHSATSPSFHHASPNGLWWSGNLWGFGHTMDMMTVLPVFMAHAMAAAGVVNPRTGAMIRPECRYILAFFGVVAWYSIMDNFGSLWIWPVMGLVYWEGLDLNQRPWALTN